MRSSINEYKYFEKYIRDCIADNAPSFVCFLARIKSFDNLCVCVEILSNDTELLELKQVPLIQSNYYQPFIQNGDIGLILPINNAILNVLLDKDNLYNANTKEYVFLPLATKDKAIKGEGNKATLQSPNTEIKITMSDEGIDCISKKDNVSDDDLSIESKNTISANTKDFSLESDNISITSTSPLEIGASNTLGALIGELIDTLTSLTTTNAVVGAPCALNPATIAQLTTLKAKIQANFK